jgi:hypothetical protein
MASTLAVGGDINSGGNYIVNEQGRQDHVANTMPSPYYRFDGSNDLITIAHNANLDFGTGDFSVEALVNIPTGGQFTFCKLNSWVNQGWFVRVHPANGYRIRMEDSDGGELDSGYIANNIPADTWVHVLVTFDRDGSYTLYQNGVNVSSASITGYDASISTTGDLLINGYPFSGTTYTGPSEVAMIRQFNKALTSTEVKELYSGASVPFKYKGANQTKVIDLDLASATGWTLVNATIAGGVLTLGGDASSYGYKNEAGTTEKGRRYAITYEIVSNDQADGTLRVEGDATNKIFNSHVTMPETVGVHTVYSDAYTAGAGTYFMISLSDSTSGTVVIDNIYVTQIGAVAEYDGSGAGHNQWLDKSGNELHGDVSGASLENTGANHTEKYVDLTVTGDTSFTLPKGYRVSAVTTKETAGNSLGGGMDIGTTDGGAEVVAAHAVSASTTAIATIVAAGSIGGTHTTADDTLYITDADGTGWDSAEVEVRVEMQRLTMN